MDPAPLLGGICVADEAAIHLATQPQEISEEADAHGDLYTKFSSSESVEVYRKLTELDSCRLPPDTGKFGNAYFRFTVLYAFLVVAIATMPIWLWFLTPNKAIAGYIIAGIVLSFGIEWLLIAFNAARNMSRMYHLPAPSTPAAIQAARARRFRHVIIVPCYLDPLEILHACIESLAAQASPTKLVVVVTFEKKTPDLRAKMASVQERFAEAFGALLVVVHTLDKRSEIPGGCSNKNFALREAYKYCSKHSDDDARHTLTTCDTDSKFHPLYFDALEAM